MKIEGLKLRIGLCFLVAFFAVLSLIAIAEVNAADPIIVGKWDRLDGADKYTIYANHVTQTVIGEQTYHGTWDYDGSSGYKYIFHWEHSPPGREPFIDYVTVAADGQSYSGYNNYGDHFNCVRLSSETDSVPATDSGFPILYVAVGGGVAAAAVVGAAVYHFVIAGESAGSKTAGAASGSSTSTPPQGNREVAQMANPAADKPQDPVLEKKQYNMQEKNADLSTSKKHNTRSKAENQPPAQGDAPPLPSLPSTQQNTPQQPPSDKPSEEVA